MIPYLCQRSMFKASIMQMFSSLKPAAQTRSSYDVFLRQSPFLSIALFEDQIALFDSITFEMFYLNPLPTVLSILSFFIEFKATFLPYNQNVSVTYPTTNPSSIQISSINRNDLLLQVKIKQRTGCSKWVTVDHLTTS